MNVNKTHSKIGGTGDFPPNHMKKTWPFPYIIIATGNENKLKQFKDLFRQNLSIEVKGLKDFSDLPEIVEDRDTFEGNACKKAEVISNVLQAPVISDDSGLVVPALDGQPGVYSARYAGPHATDEQNNLKLIENIRHLPEAERQAYYVCVMALAIPNEPTQWVRGECHGQVITEPKGTEGFGYDPIFYLPEEGKTMAQLPANRKYQMSHRAKATEKLMELLTNRYQFASRQ